MVDEKIIDGATFVFAALVGAIIFYAPQIQGMFVDDPTMSLIVGIVMMTVTNVGSRFAIKQVRQEQAEPPMEEGAA